MRSKRWILIALTLVAVAIIGLAVVVDQSNTESSPGAIKLGVAIYKGDDTFIGNMMTSLRETAAAFENETGVRVTLGIVDGQESQSIQNNQIERYLSLGYDVLCINLVDRTDASVAIDMAKEANTPVVFFNREPVQADLAKWDKLYYVGSDARESARMEAKIVIDLWENERERIDTNGDGIIQYIMLEGESRHQDAIIRTEVSVETLKDAGIPVERLDGGIANWNRSQAAALIEGYFDQYGQQIELIICNNDDMALGAVDAIDRLGLKFSNIVGIDGTEQGLQAVKARKMLGTVLMDLDAHAKSIFDLAYALAANQPIDSGLGVGADRCVRVPMKVFVGE